MTALQVIIKEAKAIRKKMPKIEWKKAVAQASAIYASKHKGKSPVGKKKAVKKVAKKKAVGNVTLKKSNRFKGDDRYSINNDGKKHLEGKLFSKETAKNIAVSLRKVKAKRKKSAKKIGVVKKATTMHKDTKSHNVNIRVMSGIFTNVLAKIKNTYYEIDKAEKLLNKYNKIIRSPKSELNIDNETRNFYIKEREKLKKYIKENKTHVTQLKKSI